MTTSRLSLVAASMAAVMLPTIAALIIPQYTNSSLTRRSDVLMEMEGAIGTYYYDLTGKDICAKQHQAGWSEPINSGITNCGQVPLNDPLLSTNRIVALNWTMMRMDMNAYCGKEVEIYQGDTKFEFSEGKFVLWDTCERCMCEKTVDISSLAYAELTNQADCSANLPTGLRVVVTNNQIWEPDLITTGTRTTWSPEKKVDSIPLKVTNTAPVFPCRTPGNICNNVTPESGGMPVPALIAGSCHIFPSEQGVLIPAQSSSSHSEVPTTVPISEMNQPAVAPKSSVITVNPAISGTSMPATKVEVSATPAILPLSSASSRPDSPTQMSGQAASVVSELSVNPHNVLGGCDNPGEYGCVQNQPVVCGQSSEWVAIAPACTKCIMLANGAPFCEN